MAITDSKIITNLIKEDFENFKRPFLLALGMSCVFEEEDPNLDDMVTYLSSLEQTLLTMQSLLQKRGISVSLEGRVFNGKESSEQ